MRAGFLRRVTAAFRGVTAAAMPAGSGLAALADVPDRERRDGFSQLVVRCKTAPCRIEPVPVRQKCWPVSRALRQGVQEGARRPRMRGGSKGNQEPRLVKAQAQAGCAWANQAMQRTRDKIGSDRTSKVASRRSPPF